MTEAIATHVEPAAPTAVAPAPDPAPDPPAAPEPAAVAPVTPPPEAWRESLGDELKAHPVLEQFKPEDFVSVPRSLVRSHIEAQRFIGGEKTPMPQENWTEADWAAHYARLGRPETPEGYELDAPELPEGYPHAEGDEKVFLEALHEAGCSKAQAAKLHARFYEINGGRFAAFQETAGQLASNRDAEIRGAWGESYAAKLQLANEAFHEYAGSAEEIEAIRLMKLADGTELGAHPLFLQTFARIGETLKEHEILKGDGHVGDFAMSPEQAKAEYTKLEERFYSMAKTDPDYQGVLSRMKQLAPNALGTGRGSR